MKKRNCRFEIRFTKDELSDLTKKARKARLTNAAFIRCAVRGTAVKEAPPADVPVLIREVRRVGDSLNQIMKRAAGCAPAPQGSGGQPDRGEVDRGHLHYPFRMIWL